MPPEVRHVKNQTRKLNAAACPNRTFGLITETYLPKKLAEKRWLD